MPEQYEVYNLLPTNIAVLDENGNFVFRNNAWKRSFSKLIDYSSLKNMLSSIDSIHSDQLISIFDGLHQVLRTDQLKFEEVYLASCAGKQQWIKIEVSAIDGGAVVMMTPMVEEMQVNSDLGDEAEIRGMLHDIKSPLSVMTSLSYLIRKQDGGQLSIKSHEYLESVSHTANEISYKLNLLSQHVRDQKIFSSKKIK